MGFYYGPSSGSGRPPSRWALLRRRIARYIPQPIQRAWGDTVEIFSITRVVLGIIMPIFGMMMAFILVCVVMMVLYNWIAGPR